MIQLMNCKFQLHIVPNRFTIINDFIMNALSKKPSYILSICNNTTRHDLFFKTSYIYKCKSKSLRYFREERDCDYNINNNHINDNSIISIDSSADDSDDHIAPMEHMTFGDISIKKGHSYCGYFVFEAYPFPNVDNNNNPTPNNTNPPLTPQLKTHKILSAIDEKHKTLTKPIDYTQFNELKLNTMSPSTVNKYRRQSLSTSRRTSIISGHGYGHTYDNTMTTEHSVTTLLAKALDEEHNNQNTCPWNDDLDDLIDIIVGYEIELSIGDPELNIFKCYIQFSEYSQPTYYQTKLNNINKLKQFCNGGADGLQLTHNELQTKININYKNTIHPQIQFNIGYHKMNNNMNINIVKEPEINETLDID
eukprot:19859_1